MTGRFWSTRRSQWGRVPIFPEPTHLRLSFGGGFTVVASLGAALEFFENRARPETAGFGGIASPRKSGARGSRAVGRAWVGVWKRRSGGAWGMPGATPSSILGAPAPVGASRGVG